jgi:hypothetical protein
VKRSISFLVLVALEVLFSACIDDSDDGTECAAVAFGAVRVRIAGNKPIVAVTATQDGATRQCLPRFTDDGGTVDVDPFDYVCIEMGGGEYLITVHTDEHRWTRRVQVKSGRCHVTEPSTITLDLASEPAGPAELAQSSGWVGGS